MKKLILFLLIATITISLYSYRVTEGMIRLTSYEVIHADILGLRNENLYILTRSDVQRELFILQKDDIQAVFRRGRGERLRREVTGMVFGEPDWFNFNIIDHIDGFRWFNQNLSHNEAHIELLALITTFTFNDHRPTGVRTFNSLHRQLRSLDLTTAYNAELINVRTSIAQGVTVEDLLTQQQTPARTDIPTLPFFTPDAEGVILEVADLLNENINTAIQNAVLVLSNSVSAGVTIAVITVRSSEDDEMSGLVSWDVMNRFAETGNYRMVEMQTIITAQAESGIQFTGEIDDSEVIRFGRTLGADIVVMCEFIRTGRSETLTLRALSVETGETVGMARERVN